MTEVGVHEFDSLKHIWSIVALGIDAQPLYWPSGNSEFSSLRESWLQRHHPRIILARNFVDVEY